MLRYHFPAGFGNTNPNLATRRFSLQEVSQRFQRELWRSLEVAHVKWVDHAKPKLRIWTQKWSRFFKWTCRATEPYGVPVSTKDWVAVSLFSCRIDKNCWVNVLSSWGIKQGLTKRRWFKVILSSSPLLKLMWSYWKLLDFLERFEWIDQLHITVVIFKPTQNKCMAMLYVKPTSIFWGSVFVGGFLFVFFMALIGSVISPHDTRDGSRMKLEVH